MSILAKGFSDGENIPIALAQKLDLELEVPLLNR